MSFSFLNISSFLKEKKDISWLALASGIGFMWKSIPLEYQVYYK
jgi:hypothetical protein